MNMELFLDERKMPTTNGVYLARSISDDNEPKLIQVYRHPTKGLCCFASDMKNRTRGHQQSRSIPVRDSGLEFLGYMGCVEYEH